MQLKQIQYFIPVILAFIFTLSLSLVYNAPIGTDIYFHLKIAESWASGQLGMFSSIAMTMNLMPYPPLLHLLLVPSVWLNIEIPFATFLQVFLYPTAILSSELLLWSQGKKYEALLVGSLLLGSYAFFDRSVQVNPQALDMILLPIAVYGVVSKKSSCLVVSSILMIYNHGIVALALLGGLFLYEILRKNVAPVLYSLGLSAPILLLSLYYLPSALGFFGGKYENLQEAQFWVNPLLFTLSYQRLLAVGFFVPLAYFGRPALNHLEGWKELGFRFFWGKWTDLEKVSLLTLVSMALMILPWSDRFTQYSTIPLSMLLVGLIMRSNPRLRAVWKPFIATFAILFYYTLWIWLLAGYI